jgi:glucose-6-phosphate isomerase
MQCIHESTPWIRLKQHAEDVQLLHLRDLLKDADRCESMRAEYDGILLDYSRQNATVETMV